MKKYRKQAEENEWLSHEELVSPSALGEALRASCVSGLPGPVSGVAPWGEFVKAKRDEGVELQALLGLVREEGYAGSYSSLRRFVARVEKKSPVVYMRVETAPGEEAQVDFGYVGCLYDPSRVMFLRSLSKKKMYGSPNSNPVPRIGGRQGEPHIMGKVLPSQRLLKQFEERLVFGDMNLSEIVRSGAQMMLQYALEREVTEALGRGYYENAPETTKEKGRRNGYESHRVLTGEGAVTVQVPQIRETSTGFRSKILDAYVSRTEKLDELIARMYVHGMSTRDIEATFADVLSGTGVSKSVVSRVTQCLSDDFEVFRKRDLSSEELLYLELDGTFLRYHQGAEKKEPILVATGYRIDGTRVLLHIGVGNGESYANWKGFLQEMVARGLREPLLIVTDGNPGVLKAIEEVFPQSLKQRCQKHRLENILGKAPKEIHDELKAEILESFHAKSYEQGLKKGREVITRYRQRFPSAMNGMEETLEACLQVLRLPEAHHKRLRTSNLLERTFGELKRRTKVRGYPESS